MTHLWPKCRGFGQNVSVLAKVVCLHAYADRRPGVGLRRRRTQKTTVACRNEPREEPLRMNNPALQNVAGQTHRFRPCRTRREADRLPTCAAALFRCG
jgi:hypothetical protein